MKKAANVVLLLTHKRDSLIWLALLFSFVSHVISFLQFCISFEGLQVPERWFGQFTFLVACSMLAASLQFLLYKQWSALYICLASRFFILFFATYPMGNFIAVKTTLLTSLVFETMIYSTFPFSLIISTAFIAMSIIIRKSGSAWDRQVMWISFDNLLFVGFYPLIAMVLGGALKDAYMKASERRKLIEQIRSSSMNLVDTNIKLQEYIIKSEENTKLQERERISRELHDTIGYTLMNIIVLLKACMELAKTDTTTVFNLMAQGIDQAQKGLAETRVALRAIRSTKLMRQTLDTAHGLVHQGVVFHVQQPGGVVGALQEGAEADEVEGLVLQHGAHGDAARQVRAELHPFEECAGIALEALRAACGANSSQVWLMRLPDLGGQRAAHGAGVLARGVRQRRMLRRVGGVGHHEVHHVAGVTSP